MDTKRVLEAAQKDVCDLKQKLETETRAKDSLEVEMGLQKARHENQLRKTQTELEAHMEKKVCLDIPADSGSMFTSVLIYMQQFFYCNFLVAIHRGARVQSVD